MQVERARSAVGFQPFAGGVQVPRRETGEPTGYDLPAHLSGEAVRAAMAGQTGRGGGFGSQA